LRADDAKLEAVEVGALEAFDQALEVLARLERGHGEDVVSGLGRPVLSGERGADAIGDDLDLLLRDAQEIDDFVPRERGAHDDLCRRPGDLRQRQRTVAARPEVECVGVSEHGEVVDGGYERDARAHGGSLRRTVQDVQAVGTGCPRECLLVPACVAPELSKPSRPGQLVAQHLDRLVLEPGEQGLQITRRAGTREGERGDVDA
jgi:hypothetical protein